MDARPAVSDAAALKDALLSRVPKGGVGCFLCAWILADLAQHGRLTGAPYDYNHKEEFPEEAKERHLRLEGIS